MTKAEKEHLTKLVDLGCICCRLNGFYGSPAEVHHIRAGTGMGRKSSHFDALPICPAHHRGTMGLSVPSIHGSKNAFIAAFGTEAELLELTKSLL